MDRTESLLQYDPLDAIVMMLNLENGTSFPIDDLVIGPPQPGAVKNTRVHIGIRRKAGRNDDIPYEGEIDFEYNRLDLAHHFAGVLSGADIELPTSVQVLLNVITERVGQTFILDDIVLEDIGRHNAGAFLLRAKSESHRWYGQFIVHLGGVTDINDILDAYAPSTLGDLQHANPFSTFNVAIPYINATAWQNDIAALQIGAHPQDGEPLLPIFSKLAIPYHTPHYRVPLHHNTHFEQGHDGWSAVSTGTASVSYASNRCQLTLQDGAITLSRTLSLVKNGIVEVTVEGSLLEPILVGNGMTCNLALQVSSANGQWVQTIPMTTVDYADSFARTFQAYVRSPFDGQHTYRLIASGTNVKMSLRQISYRSFPPQWVLNDRIEISDARVLETSHPSCLSYVGTTLKCGSNAVTGTEATLKLNLPVYGGRSYRLSFVITEDTLTNPVFLDYQDGSSMLEIRLSQHGIGEGFVVFSVPAGATGGELTVRLTDDGGQASLTGLALQPLPLPFNEDHLPNHDFNEGLTGFTQLNPAFGQLTMIDGRLYSETLTNTTFGLRFKTPSLVPSEQYRIQVESESAVPYGVQVSDRYLGIKITQTDGTILDFTSGSAQTWNQTTTGRYLNPATLLFTGQSSGWNVESAVVIDAFNYYYPSGPMQDGAFGTLLHSLSVTVDYSEWVVDAGALKVNLYNASLQQTFLPLGQVWNSYLGSMSQRHDFVIDPTYSTEYVDVDARFPFVPASLIESSFQAISQFTRFNVLTAEDMSYYRTELAALAATTVITVGNFPTTAHCDPTQPTAWIVSPTPAMKNLFGATVQYNGPLRSNDPVPLTTGLNRVIVLFLSPTHCLGYRGQIRFYYNGRYLT